MFTKRTNFNIVSGRGGERVDFSEYRVSCPKSFDSHCSVHRLPRVSCFPTRTILCTFSRAFYLLLVFQRLPSVTHFPALTIRHLFSRAYSSLLIFPRLPSVTCCIFKAAVLLWTVASYTAFPCKYKHQVAWLRFSAPTYTASQSNHESGKRYLGTKTKYLYVCAYSWWKFIRDW